jgi:hypothetical protein
MAELPFMKRLTLLIASTFLAAGCATAINKSTEQIPVRSTPAGAVVSVACGDAEVYGGVTPTIITVPRAAQPCSITLAKEGYADVRVDFRRERSRASQANRIAAAPVGLFASVISVVLAGNIVGEDAAMSAGYGIGSAIAAAPGDAFDERHGGAFKQVPGEVEVTLEARVDDATTPAPPR